MLIWASTPPLRKETARGVRERCERESGMRGTRGERERDERGGMRGEDERERDERERDEREG